MVTKNLISAMIAYGEESCWTDQDVFEALWDCGLRFNDFEKAGFGAFARQHMEAVMGAESPVAIFSECNVKDLSAEQIESDPYLYTCCADKGYCFLVRGVDKEDAQKCGNAWYESNVFEAGHFTCWKTQARDLLTLDRSEVLESNLYLNMVKKMSTVKTSLSEQIQSAETRAEDNQSAIHSVKEMEF